MNGTRSTSVLGYIFCLFLGECLPLHETESLVTVSVLGRDKGYLVPLPEGVPEETPEGKGLYLTIYHESSNNTDSI